MHKVSEELLISGLIPIKSRKQAVEIDCMDVTSDEIDCMDVTSDEIDCMDVTSDEIQQKWSEEKIIQYGVPQGSILGLLLLLIYVNDIDTNISNDIGIKLTLFADDT